MKLWGDKMRRKATRELFKVINLKENELGDFIVFLVILLLSRHLRGSFSSDG